MTGVDVAAIRARLRAAVDQRWVRFYSAAQCADHIRTETTREWVAQFAATPHIAEFIAHAPTDIRVLLDALAVAEQQRDDALAKIAGARVALQTNVRWPIEEGSGSSVTWREAILRVDAILEDARAALTDPRPTSNVPTWCMTAGHEDVPADVEGTLLGADPPITGIRYCRECADVMGDDFRADPCPPSATPTAETVPPRVAGTGGSAQ